MSDLSTTVRPSLELLHLRGCVKDASITEVIIWRYMAVLDEGIDVNGVEAIFWEGATIL